MVFTSKKYGMYSCRLSLYAYAVSIQAVVGVLMLMSSPNELDIGLILKIRRVSDIYKLGYDLLQYGGVLHLILALATLFIIVLSHFVTRLFRIPMFILSMVQTSYCGLTAGACFFFLQRGYSRIDKTLLFFAKNAAILAADQMESLIVDNRNLLLVTGLLATIMGSLYQRAGVIKGDASTTAAMVMAPTLSLGLGVAFVLCAPCRDYKTFVLGFFWFLVTTAGEVITTLTKWSCLKPLKITMLAVYVAMVLLSLITVSLCAKIYSGGLLDYTSYVSILKGKAEAFAYDNVDASKIEQYKPLTAFLTKVTTAHTDEQINMYMGNGVFLQIAIGLSTVLAIFGIISVLYCVFRVLDWHGGTEEGASHEVQHHHKDIATPKNVCIVVEKR